MDAQILAALITATATVLAAVIGVTGVLVIVQHRKKVTRLAEQVEAYYHHETALLRELYRLRHPEQTLTNQRRQAQIIFCTEVLYFFSRIDLLHPSERSHVTA